MKLAYDCVLRKVGCPILQAALGGIPALASLFDSTEWTTAPTPDLRVYETTQEQLDMLLEMHARRCAK